MRKTETISVPDWGGRDAGKIFFITEKPAMWAEKWMLRLIIALKGTSAEVPPEVASLGFVGVAVRGLNAFLAADVDPAKLEPLLDDMLTCVQIIRDPKHPDIATAIVNDDDIREVKTLLWLRSEVIRLHTNFSLADAALKLISDLSSMTEASQTT